MSQAWRVRAGGQARHAMRFHGGGFVALSWQEVPGSVVGMTKEEIRYYYSETPLVADDLFGHRVPVEWHGVNDKRRLPDDILRSFDTRISLVRLPRPDDARDLMTNGLRQDVAP